MTETFFKPITHYGKDLEQAILGACMLEPMVFGRIYSIVEEETFYFGGHKIIFSAMKKMYAESVPLDIFTVTEWVVNKLGMESVDGDNTAYFVTKLTNYVVSTANIEYHCYLIKEMWQRRKVLEIRYNKLSGTGLDPVQDVEEINQQLNKILSGTIKSDWVDMSELMVKLYRHQEEMQLSGGVGIHTGLKTIDRENGGIHAGQMVVIGARPSVGKSALAGSIAMSMAKNGKVVGIISLEMSNTEIAARLAALDTDTDFGVLYRGLYRDENETQKVYTRIANHTSTLPIYVSDKTDVNVLEIKAKANKLKGLHGLNCLIIDYLQLVDAPEAYNRSRENEIAKISRACKLMAKDMNIPVILLCQLNREVTKRKGNDRYPQLSDLRESGSIEQDADVVMFLHSDWMSGILTDDGGNTTEGKADLVIRKWRNGKNNFIIPLDFDGPKMKFTEAANYGFHSVPAQDHTEADKKEMPF